MNRRPASVLLSACILLSGCELKTADPDAQNADLPATAESVPTMPPQLPALYAGVLPCADCAGIRYELDLRPQHVYFLRTTYLGTDPDNAFDDIGRWSLAEEQALIVLRGGREAAELFAIEDAVTLRKRDIEGREIDTNLNYDITLQRAYVPLEPSLRMRGWYRTASAEKQSGAVFEECLTGLTLGVAEEGDHAALRQAYETARTDPQQRLLARLEGRIVKRAATGADLSQDVLVIEQAGGFTPGDDCHSKDRDDDE